MDVILAVIIVVMSLFSPLVWKRTNPYLVYGYCGTLMIVSLTLLLKSIS